MVGSSPLPSRDLLLEDTFGNKERRKGQNTQGVDVFYEPKHLKSGTQSPRVIYLERHHGRDQSQELTIARHATSDSVVEGILDSLNSMPTPQAQAAPVHPDYRAGDRRVPRESALPNPRAGLSIGAYPSSPSSDYDFRAEQYFTTHNDEDEQQEENSPLSANEEFSTPRQTTPRVSDEFSQAPHSSPFTVNESQQAHDNRHASQSQSHTRVSSRSTVALDPSGLPPVGRHSNRTSSDEEGPQASVNSQSLRQNSPPQGLMVDDDIQPRVLSIMERSRPLRSEFHDFDAYQDSHIPQHNPRNASPPSTSQRFERSGLSTVKAPGLVTLRSPNATPQKQSDLPFQSSTGSPPSRSSGPRSSRQASGAAALSGNAMMSDAPSRNDGSPASGLGRDVGQGQQKTGFFKRMFGSKQATTATTTDSNVIPQLPPLSMEYRQEALQSSKMSLRSSETPVSPPRIPKPPPEPEEIMPEPPQVLHKKSSFFRRKKKHSADKDKPAAESMNTASKGDKHQPTPSVSSLRQVMNPFLDKGQNAGDGAANVASPEAVFFDSKESQPSQGKSDADPYTFGPALATNDRSISVASSSTQNLQIQTGNSRPVSKISATSSQRDESTMKKSWLGAVSSYGSGRASEASGRKGSAAGYSMTGPLTPVSPTGGLSEQGDSPRHKPSNNPSPRSATQPLRQMTNDSQVSVPGSVGRCATKVASPSRPTPGVDVDDGWVAASPTINRSETAASKSSRVFLQPTTSEEALQDEYGRASSHAGASVGSGPRRPSATPSAQSTSLNPVPVLHVEGKPRESDVGMDRPQSPNDPREADLVRAQHLFEEHNDPEVQAQTNALLGTANEPGERIRRAYFLHFDFSALNILLALRDLCARLALKGETQQLDRILSSFARRWCECNPNHGFKSADVVYSIIFSLFMLNTDLHVAETDKKLSRPQFVKNTLATIHYNLNQEGGDTDLTLRGNRASTRGPMPWRDMRSPSPGNEGRPSLDNRSGTESRLSARERPISEIGPLTSPTPYGMRPTDPSQLLVNAPYDGTMRGWEAQVEVVLKEFFNSVRQLRLPLHAASESRLHEQPSAASLSAKSIGTQRSGSIMVKDRGRSTADLRNPGSRFSSKSRSRAKFYQNSALNSSRATSRTSLEDSAWSPNASSTWSRSVFGKANSMMSTDSLGSHFTTGQFGFSESIGFAGALSNAIIREESVPNLEDGEGNLEVEDELLTMAGAPWAKEGLVQHKHHLDANAKKAKDRNWSDCFAVVEKGRFHLFSFSSKTSLRQQKRALQSGGVVGGGNWTENAEELEQFLLRQTFANVLPTPGYSKSRPHVFALSLPNGAVHLFSVGTSQIASEFASTANYWSARLSKEPLVGGVSNVEYGWSDSVINAALLAPVKDGSRPVSALHHHDRTQSSLSMSRPSLTGSMRSSADIPGVVKSKMPADRIALSDWSPPQQSLMANNLTEDEQLESLRRYVAEIQEEHAKHQELRAPTMLAFSPRHPNQAKALANWEKKSKYLLHEIVKFSNYIDCLKAAKTKKEKIFKEREDRLREDAIARGEISAAADNDSLYHSPSLPEEGVNAINMYANEAR